jgi:hypothetical protein
MTAQNVSAATAASVADDVARSTSSRPRSRKRSRLPSVSEQLSHLPSRVSGESAAWAENGDHRETTTF